MGENMTKIFISYCEEDRSYRDGFAGMLRNPNNEFIDVDVRERENFRSSTVDRSNEIRNFLREKVGEATVIALLFSNNTYKGNWLNYEIEVATSQNKPIFIVRIPGTSSSAQYPRALTRKVTELQWNSTEINNYLSKLFGR